MPLEVIVVIRSKVCNGNERYGRGEETEPPRHNISIAVLHHHQWRGTGHALSVTGVHP